VRWTLITKRLLLSIPLAVGIVLISFFLLRLMPGDPVDIMLGQGGNISERELASIRASLGLDRPLHVQLGTFLASLARGDLGRSIRDGRPVAGILRETLPATIELALAALFVATAVALPIGVLSAVRRRSAIDRVAMTGAFFGISMPPFWLGLVLILLFAVTLRWLPTSGRMNPAFTIPAVTGFMLIDTLLAGNLKAFTAGLKYLVLPAVTLGAELTAILSRVLRSSMIEVLQMDYIKTARAKGLSERKVVFKHALRNGLIPAVTVLGLQFGVLLGGNMIVETIFSWPGLGRLVVGAIFARDYPVVQGAILLYAATFLVANLLVDFLYTLLNPKIEL
jgi:peptide/nickel transport system permease protein